ncbi:MAG TPA: S8 family serine peptidase [Acidimicrobiales bacterium]|nr:S8 family serine peptidase [Acidimicrobiales bacterium]
MAVATLAVLLMGSVPSAQAAAPNDTFYAPTAPVTGLGQWGLRQINAEQAWQHGTGAGTVIAVIDTGVDLGHEDLAAKLLPGRTFVQCGQSGCDNGTYRPSDDPDAAPHHGTHVAGIAAAITNNGTGVAGVAPDAAILPINVFDGASAYTDDLAYAIDWAVAQGADVINMSLGQLPGLGHLGLQLLDEHRAMLDAAMANANAAGVVVVAAAGNETAPLCDYPGWTEGLLCVRATTVNELPAEYSNFPVKPDLLALSAPGGGAADYITQCGGGIVSTVVRGMGDTFCGYATASPELAYGEMIGSSMAAPHVAGLAALVKGLGCDRQATLDILTSTSRHPLTGSRGTYTPDYGYGIVDAEAATAAAAANCAPVATPTGAITGLVTDSRGRVNLAGAVVDCGTAGTTTTSGTGTYTLSAVPVGTYTCTSSAAGYVDQARQVTVADSATTTADFRLQKAKRTR